MRDELIHSIGEKLEGMGLSNDKIDEYFEHHGVKGMHWGIRKDAIPGVPHKTNREAKKDAKEFARAKLFYGDGAGTRRKLIKAKVESKSARDPSYKKAFDHHFGNQDLGTHASKATSERHRKDAVNSTRKTARGVKNFFMNNGAPITLSAALIGTAASNPKVRAVAKSTFNKSMSEARRRAGAIRLARDFRRMSF